MSKNARHFISCCLRKNPSERWNVRKLLTHSFLVDANQEIKSLQNIKNDFFFGPTNFYEPENKTEIKKECLNELIPINSDLYKSKSSKSPLSDNLKRNFNNLVTDDKTKRDKTPFLRNLASDFFGKSPNRASKHVLSKKSPRKGNGSFSSKSISRKENDSGVQSKECDSPAPQPNTKLNQKSELFCLNDFTPPQSPPASETKGIQAICPFQKTNANKSNSDSIFKLNSELETINKSEKNETKSTNLEDPKFSFSSKILDSPFENYYPEPGFFFLEDTCEIKPLKLCFSKGVQVSDL